MAIIPQSLDYTDKDFDSLRVRLYALVRTVFPEWTDENVADFGNILVELFAFTGDILCYYLDSNARESRITTATQRKSLLGLCKLIGYTPAGAGAATADVVFRVPSLALGDILIPAGTICSTSEVTDAVDFQLLYDVTIPKGALTAVGTVEHSRNEVDTFQSTGLAYQEFTLAATPFLDGSCAVSAGNGIFTEVSNLLSSGSTDKHFTVTVDQNDRARVRFGNGLNGVIPSGTILVAYKVGGGSAGLVSSGAINRISGSFSDGYNQVSVAVTNIVKSAGGVDRQSNVQIKQLAPLSTRVLTRCVGKDDFEIVARMVTGVARSLMLTSDEDPSIPENTGILYVVPTGGGVPSDTLKAKVLTEVTVTYPCTLTFRPSVQAPAYKTIDVRAVIHLAQGAKPSVVKARVLTALSEFFALTNSDNTINTRIDFGANLVKADGTPLDGVAWSDLFNVVRDVVGIRKVDPSSTGFLLNNAHTDVALAAHEFPVLGSVVLIDGDTGDTL